MDRLCELSSNIVPNMILDKLTNQNIILLFDADIVPFNAFAAYCIFRAITVLYKQNEPLQSLHAHLSETLKKETGIEAANIVPDDRYALLKRFFSSVLKDRKSFLSRMGLSHVNEKEFLIETSIDRRKGYLLRDHQYKQLSRMHNIGLKSSQDIFKLADSKNISYKEFCDRYDHYTAEWVRTQTLAKSPTEQIKAAIDFQSFENSTMLEGLYSLAICVLDAANSSTSEIDFLGLAEQVFFKSGLFHAGLIPVKDLQSEGYLPTDSFPFLPCYVIGHHDVLMRSNILRSIDQEWDDQNLLQKCAALSVLSCEVTDLIIKEVHLDLPEIEQGFLEFIQKQYPIWNVITENKIWTKEKVKIIRTLLSDTKAIIGK